MKYAYTLFLKFSVRCIHPNYLFYFVLIYRLHPVCCTPAGEGCFCHYRTTNRHLTYWCTPPKYRVIAKDNWRGGPTICVPNRSVPEWFSLNVPCIFCPLDDSPMTDVSRIWNAYRRWIVTTTTATHRRLGFPARPVDNGAMLVRPWPMCPRLKILGCCIPWIKCPLAILPLTEPSHP